MMIGQLVSLQERLRDRGRLLVRRAVTRDDWIADALLDLAADADGRTEWTPEQWDMLLTDLRRSDMSIEEWLDFNT